jgi:nitrogen fixation/metabolism regulation signal transduction histidine kinase
MGKFGLEKLQDENARLKETVDRLASSAQDLQMDKCYFEAILKSAVEGVLVVRQDGSVSIVNPAARMMLGLGEEAEIGKLGDACRNEVTGILDDLYNGIPRLL